MKPVVVVTRSDSAYARAVVAHLCASGHSPALVLLGSRSERALFNYRSLRRVSAQLGWREAFVRLRRSRSSPVPMTDRPPLREQAAEHGFAVREYDAINEGGMIVEILALPDAVAVLAGCGLVDRALIAAARGGCVNGHPALLPGIRGVDVVEWALVDDQPLGVTAHLVEPRVDAGAVILRRPLEPRPGEDYHAFNGRLVEAQAEVLAEAAVRVATGSAELQPNPLQEGRLVFAAPDRVHREARQAFLKRSERANLGLTPSNGDRT